MPLPTWPRLAARLAAAGRLHPGLRLFLGGAKEFYDGSLGSRTALMHEPYADDPSGGAGTRLGSVEGLAAAAGAADAAGLQVAVHAIGDLAVDEVLAAFEKVCVAGWGYADCVRLCRGVTACPQQRSSRGNRRALILHRWPSSGAQRVPGPRSPRRATGSSMCSTCQGPRPPLHLCHSVSPR